jgi:hypothetical protein
MVGGMFDYCFRDKKHKGVKISKLNKNMVITYHISCIFTQTELLCYWNFTDGVDIPYFIPICGLHLSFKIAEQHICLWKLGGYALAGYAILKNE